MIIIRYLTILGRYIQLMGRTFSVPERMRMFFKSYVKEMAQLGVNSIGIVLLISFFIGAVICIQNEVEHPKPLDAPVGKWLYNPRDSAIGVLEFNHVSDPRR